MTETKMPQAGEWWVNNHRHEIVRVVGCTLNGELVLEHANGEVLTSTQQYMDLWHHEPRCTGFDWQEPPAVDPGEGYELLTDPIRELGDEWFDGKTWRKSNLALAGSRPSEVAYRRKIETTDVWPKWYVTKSPGSGYYRCDSADRVVHVDGSEIAEQSCTAKILTDKSIWKEVTEAEALARVKPPESEFCTACGVHSVVPGTKTCDGCAEYVPLEGWKVRTVKITPVESPDDWVTQDRVPARIGKDQFNWGGGGVLWNVVRQVHIDDYGSELRHGWIDPDDDAVAHVRCRRKDLPVPMTLQSVAEVCTTEPGPSPIKPAVKRVPVRLWVHYNSEHVIVTEVVKPYETAQEIKHDADGFYVEVTE